MKPNFGGPQKHLTAILNKTSNDMPSIPDQMTHNFESQIPDHLLSGKKEKPGNFSFGGVKMFDTVKNGNLLHGIISFNGTEESKPFLSKQQLKKLRKSIVVGHNKKMEKQILLQQHGENMNRLNRLDAHMKHFEKFLKNDSQAGNRDILKKEMPSKKSLKALLDTTQKIGSLSKELTKQLNKMSLYKLD